MPIRESELTLTYNYRNNKHWFRVDKAGFSSFSAKPWSDRFHVDLARAKTWVYQFKPGLSIIVELNQPGPMQTFTK